MAENENQQPQSVSDADIFRQAMTPEPAPSPPSEQPPQQQEQPPRGDQPRDEQGRWTREQAPDAPAAAIQQQPDPSQQQPAAGQQQPDDGGPVPSWRMRELREQRDAVEARARQLELAYVDQQRQLRAMQEMFQRAQQQQQKPPELPDVITDPQGYTQHLTRQFDERLRNQEANFSFRIAHDRHGELFEHAYGEMIGRAERGDPTVVRAVMQSPDPGAAMINWFRRELTLSRVGDDPEKWFETQLEERLKDQKFSGSLLERMRGSTQAAQQQNGGGPVQLPPSLNRMAASAPAVAPSGDMSDQSLFDYAFRQGRTAR